jgi:hypothetical protein
MGPGTLTLALFVAMIALISCRASAPGPAGPAAAPLDEGVALFGDRCLGCHDGAPPPRPDLDALTARTASLALRAVLENEMPPPRSDQRDLLTAGERAQLIDWICRRTGRSADACGRIVADATEPQVRTGVAILDELKHTGGRAPSERSAGQLAGAVPAGAVAARTAIVAADIALVVTDACTTPVANDPAEAPRACVERLLRAAWSSPPQSFDARRASTPKGPAVSIAELDELFGTTRFAAPADHAATDPTAYRSWVRSRLAHDEVYDTLAPLIAPFSTGAVNIVGDPALSVGHSPSKGAFYYRVSPCKESELEKVSPWWAPRSAVWVCRDDHRPGVLVGKSGRSCDVAKVALPLSEGCGCGPHLMFCGTEEQAAALTRSVAEEVQRTMQRIVTSNRPFGELLTTSDTVRSGYADLWHARVGFFLTGRFVAPDVAQPPTSRPRSPAHKGGVLSTPIYLFADGKRTMVDAIWNDYLCVPLRSEGVETHRLLDAARGDNDLRSSSHMYLASSAGCQNCHARLEYAMAFMSGWQSTYYGMHYIAKDESAAQTRLYLRNHRDLRAEGASNLAWLGQAIVRLPEFSECMVSKVARWVYEGEPIPRPVERELLRRFDQDQDMARLIEGAVIARAFGAGALHAGTGEPR